MGEKYRKSSVRSKKESNIRNNKRSSKRKFFILNAIRINRQRNRFGKKLTVFTAIFTILFTITFAFNVLHPVKVLAQPSEDSSTIDTREGKNTTGTGKDDSAKDADKDNNSTGIGKDNSGIDITVEGGYRNMTKIGCFTPFFISVENKGESISGELQVLIDVGESQKAIYAKHADLPSGTKKLITINVPVYTANKKAEVKLVKDNKAIKTARYDFRSIIPPSKPLIGVLTENTDTLIGLSGIKLPENFLYTLQSDIDIRRKLAAATVDAAESYDLTTEVASFTEQNFPEDKELMESFDIIAISNYDTSELTDKQLTILNDWIESGKILFIGLGTNAKKTYAGLGDELKLFKIEGTKDIVNVDNIEELVKKPFPDIPLNVVTGQPENGHIILEEDGVPLAVAYNKGKGALVILTFDPAEKPILEWEGEKALWQKLISGAYEKTQTGSSVESGIPSSGGYRGFMNLEYLASNVPDTQKPPFTFLFVTIIIYILLAGPILYIILKRKDKRDLSWVIIPVSALLFTLIIYIAGFKTRYTTAVLNNISVMNLNEEVGTAEVYTTAGAFNNRRGDMTVDYNPSEIIEFGSNRNYYNNYYGRTNYGTQSDGSENYRILSKLTYGAENSYKIYNVGMWDPKYIHMSKTISFEGKLINEVSIDDEGFNAIIRNNTGLNLKDSFIIIGSNFLDIGDIRDGEERKIKFSFNDPLVKKNIVDFLNDRYGDLYYGSGQKPVPEWRELRRKRQIFDNIYSYLSDGMGIIGGRSSQIFFFALNEDDLGYELKINGKLPQKYNMNLVYCPTEMEFAKGENIHLPSGIITAIPENLQNVYFDSRSKLIEVYQNGNIDFKFSIPESIDIEEIKITWDTLTSLQSKYQPSLIRDSGVTRAVVVETALDNASGDVSDDIYEDISDEVSDEVSGEDENLDNYTSSDNDIENKMFRFYIFNNSKSRWEEFEKEFIIINNVKSNDKNSSSMNSSDKNSNDVKSNDMNSNIDSGDINPSNINSNETNSFKNNAYINREGEIKVRCVIDIDKSVNIDARMREERLSVPEIQLRGVVK